jgi:hypothetical protein
MEQHGHGDNGPRDAGRLSADLPPVPPVWRRLRRLPVTLTQELRFKLRVRWRMLGWRLRHRYPRSNVLRRAWYRTDPHHLARVFARSRGEIGYHSEPVPAPPAGTTVTLTGKLDAGRLAVGHLRLGDRELDDEIVDALGLDVCTMPFPVEITLSVSDRDDDDAAKPGGSEGGG